jgi:antitoxin (DNA-binding transcriptional repressor) of toxin-antitoxin stability system
LNRLIHPADRKREIGASEAKTHLPQLLDAVEQDETIIITRHVPPFVSRY